MKEITANPVTGREEGPGAGFEEHPTSFAQQRMWFLQQWEPDSPAYNVPFGMRIRGPLDHDVLEQTLQEMVNRHETLRTIYPAANGLPVQAVATDGRLPIEVVDLRHLPEAEREAKAQQLWAEDASRPIDLGSGPVVRASLHVLADDDHCLMLTIHHIIWDVVSYDVFMKEFRQLYRAFAADQPSPLPPLQMQYREFAAQEAKTLRGEVLERKVQFWREQIEGVPPLELPTDRPRPAYSTTRGDLYSFDMPAGVATGIRALGRKQRATPFLILMAAYQALLHRYTGQDDFALGFPIAGRTHPGTQGLIGLFVNSLPLRANCAGDPTFAELVGRVQDTFFNLFEHQELPFDKLVQELQIPRDPSRQPVFQVVFTLQGSVEGTNADDRTLAPGVTFEIFPVSNGTAKFDLGLQIDDDGGTSLRGHLNYNADLFERETVVRMGEHYTRLLQAVVADPSLRLSQIEFLGDEERERLLVEWNRTERDYAGEPFVPVRIEEHARTRPDADALVFNGQRLTWRELNERANQLAHRLRKLGVGPDELVAVCTERSFEAVVGPLAVLKAGGAYVPLDATYPTARLAYLLEDTGARVLLTQEHLLEKMPEERPPVICLDRDLPDLASESVENPDRRGLEGRNLAYVIYTSGSTGMPKGVQIEHEALRAYVYWARNAYGLTPEDRTTLVAALTFDVSIFETWNALGAGTTVCIADDDTRTSAPRLLSWLVENQVTVAIAPPVLVEGMMQLGVPPGLRLRTLLSGGDQLHYPATRPPYMLTNNYGPTEYTVCTTWCAVDPDEQRHRRMPLIGRPVFNTHLYVLDKQLRLVPTGMPGELYISGAHLARGYLRRPGLTAERFLANPYGPPGSRMYRTGDLVRYLPTGELDFLGRVDNQIKLRGIRIELGEIEAVLARHPAIAEAAVAVHGESAGDKRLAAYIVTRRELPPPSVADLRALLKSELPVQMVPAVFLTLDSLPLNQSGKVDRAALPQPEVGRRGVDGSYTSPRSPIELDLVDLWTELLQADLVGIDDNFFDLGGDSLKAGLFLSRVEESFGVKVPLRQFFAQATIAELGAIIDDQRTAAVAGSNA